MKLKNLLYVACACVASYSFARYVEYLSPLSEEERNRKMAEFAAVRQSLNTAIDDLTNALADEVQRITSAIANKNSHTNQIELDPEISKLKNLTQKLWDFSVDSLLTDNSDLQSAVGETSPSSQPQINPVNPVNPVNSPQGNQSVTPSTPQIGVSDSDNPGDPLSSPPLGSPATILQGSGAPTDAVIEGNSAVNAANANADDPALDGATPENTAPRGD